MSTTNGTPDGLRDTLFLLADPTAAAIPVKAGVRGREVNLHVRRWTVRDRLRVVELGEDKTRPAIEKMVDLVRMSACGPDGTLLFPAGDDSVLDLPGDVADAVVDAAMKANGLGGKKGAADPGNG